MSKLIKLTAASMPADAMRLRIILDRANIPYHCFNELNFLVTAQGPIQFFVPEIFLEEALDKLKTAFEVQMDNLPDFCPACGTQTLDGIADCPACGLFLG